MKILLQPQPAVAARARVRGPPPNGFRVSTDEGVLIGAAAEARKKGAGGSSEDKKMPKLKTGSGGLTRDANYQTLIEAGYSRDEAVKLSNQHANQSYDNRKAAEERRNRRNG